MTVKDLSKEIAVLRDAVVSLRAAVEDLSWLCERLLERDEPPCSDSAIGRHYASH